MNELEFLLCDGMDEVLAIITTPEGHTTLYPMTMDEFERLRRWAFEPIDDRM